MWDYISRIHDHHCNLTVETRILKLTEEVGEAAEAYIGMHGLNSRKGICKTRNDLLAELADVIVTAAVAMVGVTDGDTTEASEHLQRRLHDVTTRVGI